MTKCLPSLRKSFYNQKTVSQNISILSHSILETVFWLWMGLSSLDVGVIPHNLSSHCMLIISDTETLVMDFVF